MAGCPVTGQATVTRDYPKEEVSLFVFLSWYPVFHDTGQSEGGYSWNSFKYLLDRGVT